MPLFGRKKSHVPAQQEPERDRLPDPPEPDRGELRSLDAHRDYLLSCVEELPPFSQHILDALDLSLCEDIISEIDLPRFDNSAMDGYAVRADGRRRSRATSRRSACRWWGRSPPASRRRMPAIAGHRDEDHDRRPGARRTPTR